MDDELPLPLLLELLLELILELPPLELQLLDEELLSELACRRL